MTIQDDEEASVRGEMRLAALAFLATWAVFGLFIAWLCVAVARGGWLTFVMAFAIYVVVSLIISTWIYRSVERNL